MAILLNNAPNNITEYPHSLKRQGAFPLEYHSVFQTFAAAQEYAQNNLVAYVGQPIAVTEETTSYYVIANTRGDLIKLGDGNLDMNEVDRRLKEIEKFFALEEGESLKDTLDELVELQKWIEEHLATFEETVTNINKTIADEEDRAVAAEQKLNETITNENKRALEAEKLLQENINAEAKQRGDLSAELLRRIDEEIKIRNEKDEELNKLIEAETTRANKADDELYQAIEDLTEEDIHLKTDLYTYVNIGKITGASDTSRKKVASKGDSLKAVFNAILGTRQDKQPTITNNASLTVTDSKTYGGGEYGTAVAEVTETITFTLSNTGTTNYGYKVGETEHKGSQTFYYPIVKQEEADIKITLPENKTATVLTENALVKTVGNILYCNLTNKQVQIQITLAAGNVTTSEQTRYDSISSVVSLGTPEDAEGNTITSFLTYLESEGETAQVTPPSPEDKKGGDKTDSTGAYKINKGYIPYTYCLSESLPSALPATNRTEKLPSSITVSGGNDNTYLYIFVPTGKSDIKTLSASGFAVPFTKASTSKNYAVNNGKETSYKVFKTEGSVKADTFIVG